MSQKEYKLRVGLSEFKQHNTYT